MAAFHRAALCVLLTLVPAIGVSGALSCLDAQGNPVDWWTILKGPLGAHYAYIDSSSTSYKFSQPTDDLSTTHDNPLADTLQQIYDPSGVGSPPGVGYVIWNDDPGVRSPSVKRNINQAFHAHSKGVLGFEEDGGFYLLHSTPNFPDNPADSEYQGISNCGKSKCGNKAGQFEYAQSYLCVTLDPHNLDNVAKVLRGDYLVVYGAQDGGVTSGMPDVARFVQQDFEGLPMTVPGVPFQTVGGESFLLFGMSPSEPQHPIYLYEELIEPTLGAGLKVQTWTESPRFPSYCPGGCEPAGQDFKETINVKNIKLPGTNIPAWRAENLGKGMGQQDHSKWAVTIPDTSASKDVKVLCIADINRAGHQLLRGGGAACFTNNPGMWKLFDSVIQDVEKCLPTCPSKAKPRASHKRPTRVPGNNIDNLRPPKHGARAHKVHAPYPHYDDGDEF